MSGATNLQISKGTARLSGNQTLIAGSQTGNFSLTLPTNCYIQNIFVNETAGNAITGGLNIGTTALAADIVSARAVGANSIQIIPVASILKQIFSTSASQQFFISAAGSWNGASINFEIIYASL